MNIIFSTESLVVAPPLPSPPCCHHPFSPDHHRFSRTAVNTTCLTAIIIAQPFFFLASSSHLAATHCRFFISPFQPKTHKSIQCGRTKSPIATTSFPRTNVIRHREREPERDLLPRPLSSSSLPNRNEPLAATTKAPLSVKSPAAERRPPCASRHGARAASGGRPRSSLAEHAQASSFRCSSSPKGEPERSTVVFCTQASEMTPKLRASGAQAPKKGHRAVSATLLTLRQMYRIVSSNNKW
ncbi:hypothetical protein LR48_Vigan312s001500 [Vigna angularis]|uniref:Uncharacterized protein n=1 Tax=Phaseolus angularis TaxID=3914 RepID=A0A0L9T9H3_PHAAN|nr:hypothetical protein LR48_Vigan312s001500 [Vigna angularis]